MPVIATVTASRGSVKDVCYFIMVFSNGSEKRRERPGLTGVVVLKKIAFCLIQRRRKAVVDGNLSKT